MKIRSKLLLLLLSVALLPMVLLGWSFLSATEEMGRELTAHSRVTLIAREQAYLEEKVSDTARLLRKHFTFLEYAIEEQAREVEERLAAPPPAPREGSKPYVLAEDFDAGRVETEKNGTYRKNGSSGHSEPLPVSFERVVHLLHAKDPERHRDDVLRMEAMHPVYARLHELESARTVWHYTSLENGLHSSFPGHGGYPEAYDPRERPWYRSAVANEGPVWSLPMVDASSGQVVNTISMAVHRVDGSLAGVTSIDVSTPDIFSVVSSAPRQWQEGTEAMIVAPTGEGSYAVHARASAGSDREARSWDDPEEMELLDDTTGSLIPSLSKAWEDAEVGLAEAPYRGEASLWAFAPLGTRGGILAVVVPVAQVLAKADEAASYVEGKLAWQGRVMKGAMVVASLLIALLAIPVARSITLPLSDLSRTADEIAQGDHGSRIELSRKDEIGSLGQSVNQMATSIDELLTEQEQACMQMLKSLTKALQSRDAYTAAHSGRVAHYSRLLGERIGLDSETLEILTRGALVHDLGKIGVPESVLNKGEALTEEEFEVIKNHPRDSAIIMRPLVRLKAYAEIAAWHHEHWDGSGYPDGLAGEDIPLMARIVAIADTWDAMTGDRTYRKGIPIPKAVEIIEREQDSGQWDPQIIREFIALVREELERGAEKGAPNEGREIG